ncbi:MAG TPA: hypothetical protein ENF55_06645, partial [Thermoprotei archaeon]|nr:hypothetical protein [Thermoprotei archaeon]
MKTRCPVCGAELEVPETAQVFECPYCGTIFDTLKGSKVDQQHFYFSPTVENPYDYLMRFIERQYGVPSDLRENASYRKRVLHMIPVYFFHLRGAADVKALSRKYGYFTASIEEVDDIGIPAVDNPVAQLLEDYPFPLRGKRFLDEKAVKSGVFYKPTLSPSYAETIARRRLENALISEASSMAEQIVSVNYRVFKVDLKGLVHYPVWEIEYGYRGNIFKGYVDGVTGTVIWTEHPLAAKSRALQLALGGFFIALGSLTAITVVASLGKEGGLAAIFS